MTTTWIANLTDSGIKTDLTSLTADGTFSYTDAVTLLDDVMARGTVTSAELADLKSIALNLETQNGISSSDYVASAFYQLVEGSQANATWNGGLANASALGNLAAGTTATQLGELIGKWFLGTDLPDATGSSDSTQPTLKPTYSDYSKYVLFGTSGAPQVSDVAQGYDGDCELCSGMIEMLQNHPGLINSMFVDDGNGVYGVRFYVNGKETWVTVDSQLPTYKGQLLYNDPLLSGGNDGLWASLIEKAYAQLSADGLIGHPATNSYDNISADTAFDVLTNLVNTSSVQYLLSSSANWTAYKNIVIEAVQAGDDVIVETGTATNDYTTNASGQKLLVADHAFAVIGYDSGTGDFIVRNPWGVEPSDNSYVTQFEVSIADIAKVEGDFVFDNSAQPDVVINFAEQIAGLASTTNASFTTSQASLGANSYVKLSSLIQPMDTAGQPILYYKIELLGGTAGLNLNGAINGATAAQTAAGEVIVSAADLGKLTISTGASGGDIDLFVSGYDSAGWSAPTEIYFNVDSTQLSVLPAVDTIVAPSTSVSVASLFSLSTTASTSGLTYFVQIESGGGTINLNGATDMLGGGGRGQIEVSAADLAKLTYTASSASGVAVLDVTAAANGYTSDIAQVPVDVGYSVSATLSAFDASETPYQVAVSDSAADVFASLDQLEQMMPNWALLGITLTDASIPTETITAAQLSADRGVLSIIESKMVLDVTATGTESSIQGLSNIATVVVFSGTASQYTIASTAQAGTFDVTGPNGGITALSDVVALQFSDHEVIVASSTAVNGEAVTSAQITNLYAAVFAREPDVAGLNFYEQYAAANPTVGVLTYVEYFLSSSEYTANTKHNYAQTTAGETQFITDTYQNLLSRTPAANEVAFYLNVIDQMLAGQTAGTAAYSAEDKLAHATVLAYFSQSPEFLTDVQVTAAHPADASHWLVLA
jgi:hypothetical protein